MSSSSSSHRRTNDLFDARNISASNIAFYRRKLAGALGTTSRRQTYTVYTDVIFDSIDQVALGTTAVKAIESAVSQGKPGFLHLYDSPTVYPHREAPFSVPCPSPTLFARLLAARNMVEGPYAIDFNGLAFDGSYTGCFMDSNGTRVASTGPISSLTTEQPFLVYIDPFTLHLGGLGGHHNLHPPFLSYRARELVVSGSVPPTSAILKSLRAAWQNTRLDALLMEILHDCREKIHDSMAVATLTVLFPELFSSTSGVISVPPIQNFESTIGDYVLDLYSHYGSSNATTPAGSASDDTVNLVIANIASGKGFLDVAQGDGVITQLSLRDPSSQAVYPHLCLSEPAIRVRCAAKRTPANTFAGALLLALEELSSLQESNMLSRRMSLLSTSRVLDQCSKDPEQLLSASINTIKETLSSFPFPAFIAIIADINSMCATQGFPIKTVSAAVNSAQKKSLAISACAAGSFSSAIGLGSDSPPPPSKRLRQWTLHPHAPVDPPQAHSPGPVAAAMCLLAAGGAAPSFEDFSIDTYVGWVFAALGEDVAQRIMDGSKFCYGHVTTGCTKTDCPFEHVGRDMITKLVHDIIKTNGTPFYVPKSVLEVCVDKDTMLRYFELKRSLRKKSAPPPKPSRSSNDKSLRTVRFVNPPSPLSPGIPLAINHPPTETANCITYDAVANLWASQCNSCQYTYTSNPEGVDDIGNCFTTSGGLQKCSPLDPKSDGVARAIHEIFGWRDLRLEYAPAAPGGPPSTSCILGDASRLEPTAAILKTNPDGTVLDPAIGLGTALADTGSGISIICSKDFGSSGPLHHLIVFSAPLRGLGKFEVKGVNGDKSSISHLCWVQFPVMVSRGACPAGSPESVPCTVGFNAFLAEVNNPHAVIVGNKTMGALGAYVVPAYPEGPRHSSSNQLRLQGKLPSDLALHPFLVKSAQAMLLSDGCSPDVSASLRSLLLARSPPTRA